jgi:[ribosomal protein S18]-alanine N-acetyltransferase
MSHSLEEIRLLTIDDISRVRHLLQTSEYIYQRFTQEELATILTHYPALGTFSASSLRSFILTQTVHAPCAWIAGFCVSWTESRAYARLLARQLEQLAPRLIALGVRYLHYSGNDMENDWLRGALLMQSFLPYRLLYAYDKYDHSIPTAGNQQVIIRVLETRDIPHLLPIEEACFEELWRYDELAFRDIASSHPYFRVAELGGRLVGYQFNAVDGHSGYLIRIAVHPSVRGRGIGARLMAEAMRYFERAQVTRIMLNTQEDNIYAHRLYEWFGFVRQPQIGFVLRKSL